MSPGWGTGWKLSGELLLAVASVQDVGGQERHHHQSRRPSQAGTEWVESRQVDEDREPADRGEDEHDQHPADRAVAREEQLELQLPGGPMPLADALHRRRVSAD